MLLIVAWIFNGGTRRELRAIRGVEHGGPLTQRIYRTKLNNGLRMVWIPVVAALVGVVLINAATFGITQGHASPRNSLSSTYVASTFGLETGKAYPLMAGDGANGAYGVVETGYFHDAVTSIRQEESVVSVAFAYQDRGYILEIPVSRTTFIQHNDVDPTVTLHLNNFESQDFGTMTADTSRPCDVVIRTALLTCHRVIISTPRVNADIQQRGLAYLINEQDTLDSATFTVTSEMYDRIMRTRG
jgi:hypothetical protein